VRDAIALAGLLGEPNVRAFLRVIRAGEGTADEDGYRRQFGGKLFDRMADHPRDAVTARLGSTQITSTAAGAYQFLARTWDGLVRQHGFADFEPRTQDIAALALIDGRNALGDVLAGRVEQAIAKCNREWASLPGSPYGQPTRTLEQALAVYAEFGGARTQDQSQPVQANITPPKEQTMPIPAIIGALLPSIIEMIPKLGKLFGSGSEVAERNVKAAELAVSIVQEATGARNAQEAAEMIKSDPAMAQAAAQAVETRWFELAEAGGGGIDGARKADAARISDAGQVRDVFKSHSFLIASMVLPLVYLVVLSIIGLVGKIEWSMDVRAAIAGTLVGTIIGGLMGYYFGQTTSRNRSA
jgi:muramidase (phage lysozyme)